MYYREVDMLITHEHVLTVRKTPPDGIPLDLGAVRVSCHADTPAGMVAYHVVDEVAEGFLDMIDDVHEEIGVNMTLGASNVSFGMPDRHTLNAVFLPMAMRAGLTSAIMDARTPQIVESVKAADLLLGHDEWGGNWIAAFRAKQAAEQAAATSG